MTNGDDLLPGVESPNDNHNVIVMNKRLARSMPTACCFAAYARLHELEAKQSGTSLATKLSIGLSGPERAEYERLMSWWRGFGAENQQRLILMVFDFASEVFHVGNLT